MTKGRNNPFARAVFLCVILFLILFVCYSCTNKHCSELYNAVDDINNSDMSPKIVDLKEVYNFQWDTLYIFAGYSSPASMSETIGSDCNCRSVDEFDLRYIFVKDQQVVKQDVGPCDQFYLDALIKICCDGDQRIPNDNAKFLITGDHSNYNLRQVEE